MVSDFPTPCPDGAPRLSSRQQSENRLLIKAFMSFNVGPMWERQHFCLDELVGLYGEENEDIITS